MVESLRGSSKPPPNFTNETWEIFLGLTCPDPIKRWSLSQVYHHPWMVRQFLTWSEKATACEIDRLIWLDSTRRLLEMYKIPRGVGGSMKSQSRSLLHRMIPRIIFDWGDDGRTAAVIKQSSGCPAVVKQSGSGSCRRLGHSEEATRRS